MDIIINIINKITVVIVLVLRATTTTTGEAGIPRGIDTTKGTEVGVPGSGLLLNNIFPEF
jgi:hypothetical protein